MWLLHFLVYGGSLCTFCMQNFFWYKQKAQYQVHWWGGGVCGSYMKLAVWRMSGHRELQKVNFCSSKYSNKQYDLWKCWMQNFWEGKGGRKDLKRLNRREQEKVGLFPANREASIPQSWITGVFIYFRPWRGRAMGEQMTGEDLWAGEGRKNVGEHWEELIGSYGLRLNPNETLWEISSTPFEYKQNVLKNLAKNIINLYFYTGPIQLHHSIVSQIFLSGSIPKYHQCYYTTPQ